MTPRIVGRKYVSTIDSYSGVVFVCVNGTNQHSVNGAFRNHSTAFWLPWSSMLLLDECHNEPERTPKAWADVAVGDVVELKNNTGTVRAARNGRAIVEFEMPESNSIVRLMNGLSGEATLYAPTPTPETANPEEPEQWLRVWKDEEGYLRSDNPHVYFDTPVFDSRNSAARDWKDDNPTLYVAKLEKV